MLNNFKPVITEVIMKKERKRKRKERGKKEENTDSAILSYTLPNCQKTRLNFMYN